MGKPATMATKPKAGAKAASKKVVPPSPRNNRVLGHKTAAALAPAGKSIAAPKSTAMGLKKKAPAKAAG